MRTPVFLVMLAAGMLHPDTFAQALAPAVMQLQVQARADVPDLECERRAPARKSAATSNPDPLEVPSDDTVRAMAEEPDAEAQTLVESAASRPPAARPLPATGVSRIAIWGDSHLAAGFFSEELARQLKTPAENVPNLLLPANMGRAGVRLPIRRSCVSAQWKYEPGYLGGEAARAPGPGLVNMYSEQAGATIAWDVRSDKRLPRYERVRILYQQTEAPIRVGVSIDGAPESEVTLGQRAGPAVLELAADKPVSTVRMRLIDGPMRFHGLDLQSEHASGTGMDVFGYPGATVAGWKTAQLDYLSSWFSQRDYQLVMLEFGTNEGAGKPFDINAYRRMLEESVHNLRTVFPSAACVLIAPGDRGVLVRQSANLGQRSRARGKSKAMRSGPKIDLFVYSRVHAAIGRVQREVAGEAGCSTWSMMDAMGGPGQSYAWAHQSPSLMARDLIHFTVPGYQRFAQKMARDMGWTAAAENGQ
jgi:hypothetical protein